MIGGMTQVAEPPAETPVCFQPVIFLPSGRDDCLAVARMSFEDWLRLDYEGGLSEWVDGEARLYMSATRRHQALVGFLNFLLLGFASGAGLGTVLTAPYAMASATGKRGREPDLMFVLAGRDDIVGDSHLVGAPDLVIEIVSLDSVARDFVEKLREYEAAGVGEYWIIDSREGHERAEFFVHDGGRLAPAFPDARGVFRSTVIRGLWVRLAWLLEGGARPKDALAEVEAGEPA